MTQSEFEDLLDETQKRIQAVIDSAGGYESAEAFEREVRSTLCDLAGIEVEESPHPHVFPDIPLGKYGVEVKFTTQDTWRSVANSVLESTRDPSVEHVYLFYGKMGGDPKVRWGRYADCVMHVRTSHVPRFEVEMYPEESLFEKMGIQYEDFAASDLEHKMRYVREYARSRLKPGDRLWWLEEKPEPEHSLPLEVRLYMNLEQVEKRQLRAEAALLCPQIVKPPRTRNKYNDAVQYLLTYRGVLCPQARDLFSAGSVALRADSSRGGNYVQRALMDIQAEMLDAAERLEEALFEEYWGEAVPKDQRIAAWLARADALARDWRPSEVLFVGR